jgi:hypothetical protein
MGDVTGLYRRFGVRLPGLADGWASTSCFSGLHRDRNPSARVHLHSGGFKCFGCGARGGVLDALQLLGVHDREEARRLATEYGILEAPVRRRSSSRQAIARDHQQRTKPDGRVDYDALPTGPAIRHDRTWTYVDEHGEPVGRVRRLDLAGGGKRIWQERIEGGRWLPGLNGATLPLYQLPLVRTCARQGRRVLVVEGEKAVDGLERIGLVATTNTGGAGKWKPQHSSALAGATVIAICDSDLAGRLHAVDVTESLLAAGVDVRMPLDLFELRDDGSDIVDYLSAIADSARAVGTEAAREGDLRQRLRWNLERELARQLPVDVDDLHRFVERARYVADPAGKMLLACESCGSERPQRLSHGLAYCGCGAFRVVPA